MTEQVTCGEAEMTEMSRVVDLLAAEFGRAVLVTKSGEVVEGVVRSRDEGSVTLVSGNLASDYRTVPLGQITMLTAPDVAVRDLARAARCGTGVTKTFTTRFIGAEAARS